MTGLDDALVAVAANLASGALTGAAKAAWTKLRGRLTAGAKGDKRVAALLDVLEADPNEEVARYVARRLDELGLSSDKDVQNDARAVVTQISTGAGATNLNVRVNNGSIGGVHFHTATSPVLGMRRTGASAYNVTNQSTAPLTVTEVVPAHTGIDVSVRDALPIALQAGEALGVIAEASIGSGRPTLRVTFLQSGRLLNETLTFGDS